jgi:hypothetical protein
MTKLTKVLLLAACLAAGGASSAHTDEQLDAMDAPHGGKVRAAGPYHLELVATPGTLIVYVTDHMWTEKATGGADGKAIVRSGAQPVSIALEPGGRNVLRGQGRFVIGADTTIVVFVRIPGQDAQAARFTHLMVPPTTSAAQH